MDRQPGPLPFRLHPDDLEAERIVDREHWLIVEGVLGADQVHCGTLASDSLQHGRLCPFCQAEAAVSGVYPGVLLNGHGWFPGLEGQLGAADTAAIGIADEDAPPLQASFHQMPVEFATCCGSAKTSATSKSSEGAVCMM